MGESTLLLRDIQSLLNIDFIIHSFWSIQDEALKVKVLSFVVVRNTIQIQIFVRAVLKLKKDSAFRI